MTLEQGKVFLEMGSDMVLMLDFGTALLPNRIRILVKADDYDEETFDQWFSDMTRINTWTFTKDDGTGLELLRGKSCEAS